jgi:hypothetical protein
MPSSLDRPESPFDYNLEKAQIFSEKFVNDPRLEIKNLITDIEIFEHLDKPYLTATLVFVDDIDIYNVIDFSGAEKIILEIRLPGTDTTKVSKTFVIEKVLKNIKANDKNAVIALHLIEEHAFVSSLINVNKAYTGKPVDIVQKIIKDNLGREFSGPIKKDNQSDMRVVIPNLRPIEAARWVNNRATTENGLPYFFFSTLANSKLHIVALEDMLTNQYDKGTYSYSQATTAWSASKTAQEQAYIIQWYSSKNTDEIINLVRQGVVGASYNYYDTMLGNQGITIKFDIVEEINKLKGQSVLPKNQDRIAYEDGYSLKDVPFNKLESRRITNIVSTSVYDDKNTYTEEPNIKKHKQKIIAEALRSFLVRNAIDIALPGMNFLDGKYSGTIGNQITLAFLKNTVITDKNRIYDVKKSGTYLIYALKHSFKRERYDVLATCVKLGDMHE